MIPSSQRIHHHLERLLLIVEEWNRAHCHVADTNLHLPDGPERRMGYTGRVNGLSRLTVWSRFVSMNPSYAQRAPYSLGASHASSMGL